MNNECNIINDMLPLYIEDIASADTKAFVDKHLEGCAECREKLNTMRSQIELSDDISSVPLKNVKKKLQKNRLVTIIFTATLVLALGISIFSFLSSPNYLPFSEEKMSISESDDGTIVINFDENVTGYSIDEDEIDGTIMYYISAWNSTWDLKFANRGSQNAVISPPQGKSIAIYYSLNNSTENILIFGMDPPTLAGTVLLPRLVLTYYFILAAFAAIVLSILLIIFRKKEQISVWIKRVLLFPIAYILGHICIKGFTMSTYSSARDFSIIMIVTILLYLAGLLGISLYKARKETTQATL